MSGRSRVSAPETASGSTVPGRTVRDGGLRALSPKVALSGPAYFFRKTAFMVMFFFMTTGTFAFFDFLPPVHCLNA